MSVPSPFGKLIAMEKCMKQEFEPSGSCLCGQVTFHVLGAPLNVRVCHCRECQKAMAGPYFARALFGKAAINITGDLKPFATSDDLVRMFCGSCGTTLGARRHSNGNTGISLSLFDDPGIYAPTDHIWVSEKQRSSIIPDGVIQHSKGPT